MRLHTLILALFIFGARAASIVDKAEVDFEKKLTEAVKEVLSKEPAVENVASEQELIDQANGVKDVENNLRNRVQIADIPVKVVIEEVKPSVKSDIEKNKEDNVIVPESEVSTEIKRVAIDLKHPGEPQRQEHETQNPEHFVDQQQALAGIKQNVIDTQNVFNNGVVEFQQNLQTWWATNQQIMQIQEGITEMQKNFQMQVNKFNDTIQKYWKPEVPESIKSAIRGSENQATVQTGLKMLEENLKAGVKSLADGVHAMASVKQETEGSGSPPAGTPPPWGSGNPFAGYFANMQNQITQGFQNMTNQLQQYFNITQQQNSGTSSNVGTTNFFQNWSQGVQNLINQQGANQPAASQSDENAPAKPPTIWQSFQNIFNPNSQAAQAQQDTPVSPPPPGPIVQAIQNSPLYQGAVSLGIINPPNKPEASKPEVAKPEAEKPEKKPEAVPEGSNAVPSVVKTPEDKEKPQVVQEIQPGPIKQIIQKNPIVQGLAGAVQRLQHTISPEKPRDVVEGEKGIIVIDGGHGHHGHKPGHGSGVSAWGTFINGLIGTIGAVINGTTTSISAAINSAIDTLGTNIEVNRIEIGPFGSYDVTHTYLPTVLASGVKNNGKSVPTFIPINK